MPTIDQLFKVLAAEPNDPFTLYGLAQEYAKAGRTADAVAHYDKCLAADPTYCYAYYHKAKALEDAGFLAEAIETLHAGKAAAKKAGDSHALSEISGYLDMLE
ncbi:MAG: tetratricopeptide repeat protein [Phycisphaeraceae bacterium]|nr:tetratricopeptide repeat protein [Phycisphaeraceae bacterium]